MSESAPYLSWNEKRPSETSMELPSPSVEWKIELLPDYQSWRAYKRCYDIKDDGMHWVPLRGAFSAEADAHAAVAAYIANRRPIFLDRHGREIPA